MQPALRRISSAANRFAALSSPLQLLAQFLVLFAAVVLFHATLLRLPYFWDEGGYYVPAALDFYHRGTLIPEFTNAHPPLPSVLLGLAWRLFGFHILVTRLLVCLVAAGALLAILRLASRLLSPAAGLAVCMLTAVYPIWYTQSSLAHADIFAALFTLWGFALYFGLDSEPHAADVGQNVRHTRHSSLSENTKLIWLTVLFSLAALAKETSVIQPIALVGFELALAAGFFGKTTASGPAWGAQPRAHLVRALALCFPVLPLAAWFGYHRWRTGFIFGNPEFLRYNATANFTLAHFANALRFRFLHLFWQRNIWIPVLLAVVCLFWRDSGKQPFEAEAEHKLGLPRQTVACISTLVVVNWLAFSLLGGALLTRYLLPMYPLILLVCVAIWKTRTSLWPLLVTATAAAFVSAWWLNPPTYFAPEDNLTYRDMIVVHQEAIGVVRSRYPGATVLTAWPVAADLVRPELGYIDHPLRVTSIDDFTLPQVSKAAGEPEKFDTAIVFSSHFVSDSFLRYLANHPESQRAKDYNRTRDLSPREIAALLGGQVVWQNNRHGEWAAVLRFPRSYEAHLDQPAILRHPR